MPKDEFDFDDPLELNGVAMLTAEDTSSAMCECFIEEFLRMGYGHKQILAMFRNRHYLAMNLVVENKGEQFVRDQISGVFARWGRPVRWNMPVANGRVLPPHPGPLPGGEGESITASSPIPGTVSAPCVSRFSNAAGLLSPLPEGEGQGEGEHIARLSCGCGSTSLCGSQSEQISSNVDPLGSPAPDLTL